MSSPLRTRTTVRKLTACALLALLSACGPLPAEEQSTPTTSDDTTAAETSSETTTTEAETTTAAPAGPSHWKMPNLVGTNLQAAQNMIQQVTGNPVFITTSHDASGDDRHQVVDRNWKVCSQNIAPGKTFTDTAKIDFGTVKNDESCP